jgi:hypothetical protein
MKNVIEAINVLIGGVQAAYTRGAYTSMKEVHDLYEAIEYIGQAVNAQQAPPVPTEAPATSQEKTDKTKDEDYD